MTVEYIFEDLQGEPNQGWLSNAVADSGMAQTVFADISYHTYFRWLKVWFEEALSIDDQAILAGFVDDSVGIVGFKSETGSEFFELSGVQNRRWQRYRRRVRFTAGFSDEPNVKVFGARFDGTANLEIVQVTKNKFDFIVTSRGSASSRGNAPGRGLTSVEFDWEAKTWE